MPEKIPKEKRSEIMKAVKSYDSKIEVTFRKSLWKFGFRYRKNAGSYFGKPDIVLKKHKTVIFIDSCFWHGCPEHLRMPSSNRDYWVKKIEKNKNRDLQVNKHYHDRGWAVLRIWEHDLVRDLEGTVRNATNLIKAL